MELIKYLMIRFLCIFRLHIFDLLCMLEVQRQLQIGEGNQVLTLRCFQALCSLSLNLKSQKKNDFYKILRDIKDLSAFGLVEKPLETFEFSK